MCRGCGELNVPRAEGTCKLWIHSSEMSLLTRMDCGVDPTSLKGILILIH